MLELFKKETRADYVNKIAVGLSFIIKNRELEPLEIVEVYKSLTKEVETHLIVLEKDAAIELKTAQSKHTKATLALLKLRDNK